jgi:hypothetical protein
VTIPVLNTAKVGSVAARRAIPLTVITCDLFTVRATGL